MTQRIVALIDGDLLAFRSAAAIQRAVEWEPGVWGYSANEAEGREHLKASLTSIERRLQADEMVIAMSDDSNFRHAILPSYKAPRKSVIRPAALGAMREAIGSFGWPVKKIVGLEADDVLGILLTGDFLSASKRVVVSSDKDLLTVPGRHFDPMKDLKRIVSEDSANRSFYLQVLMGDRVDNYSGCPGVGPKRAAKILEGCTNHREYWDRIVAAYEKADLTEDDAIVQARVARILRAEDWNHKANQPILWSPPQ